MPNEAPRVFGRDLQPSRTRAFWSAKMAGLEVLIATVGLGSLGTDEGETIFQVDECNPEAAARALERGIVELRDKLTEVIGDAKT